MDRRTFLATTAATALAGCLGGDGDGPENTPPSSFERITVEGQRVPLAPVGVVHEWYLEEAVRLADARGQGQYERAHIQGAVWSPAPDGRPDDPVAEWPTDARIVCYCGCPHHLSSVRAASLMAAGYTNVSVIDEGFGAWIDRGYPIGGTAVETRDRASVRPPARVVRGVAAAASAGEPVYATHEPTDQREAAFVDADGRYELTLRFADVTPASRVRIDAPGYTVTAPLAELTSGLVTAP